MLPRPLPHCPPSPPLSFGLRLLVRAFFATITAVIGVGFLAPWLLHLWLMQSFYGFAGDPVLKDLSFPCSEEGLEDVRQEAGKTLIYDWHARISRGCVPILDERTFLPTGDEKKTVTLMVVTPFIRGASIGLWLNRAFISPNAQWPDEEGVITVSRVVTPGGRTVEEGPG